MKNQVAALFIAVLVLLPTAGRAQTQPPAPAPAPAQEGPLNIDAVPAEQRDQVWEAQARKNNLNINLLPPIGSLLLSISASSLLGSAAGVISIPFEYERALNRGLSVFGILNPAFAGVAAAGQSASAFSFGLGLGVRGYFSGNAPIGFWLGGEGDIPVYPSFGGATVRVESGYNFAFATNLSLSLGGGLGLTYSTVLNPLTNSPIGFFPALGLRIALGYML
jgi:hypothetical protein